MAGWVLEEPSASMLNVRDYCTLCDLDAVFGDVADFGIWASSVVYTHMQCIQILCGLWPAPLHLVMCTAEAKIFR
jgi:hypothetical protein